MAQIQSGINANDVLTVDPISKAARATLYGVDGSLAILDEQQQPDTVAGVVSLGMNDRSAIPMRLDRMGGQASAMHNPLLSDSFDASAAVHALRWVASSSGIAAAPTANVGLLFNNANVLTANSGHIFQSYMHFAKAQRNPLQVKFRARFDHYTNTVMEIGFGNASGHAGVHGTGAYWQMTAGGVLQPVLTFNGVDSTGSDIRSLVDNSSYYTFDVVMDDDEVIYVCQDTTSGLILSRQTIKMPKASARIFSASALPVMMRQYNGPAAPPTAPHLVVSDVYVLDLDSNKQRPWPHVVAAMGRASYENPLTGAQALTFANGAAPANATLSNTAAGYATLGGLFSFAAVAGAPMDYDLFSVTIPVGFNLRVTGVDIETWNTGAAVATTPTLMVWGMASLATVSLASSPQARVPLGVQSLPVGAAPGAKAERISKQFATPFCVQSGRFISVFLRMPVGTATASQVIQGMVNIEGYYE